MIKVMIADDNNAIRESCFNFLAKDEEIKVVSFATNGEETIQKYFETQPDILLLDLDMPKINGIDVINTIGRFSEEKEKCNIIVVSGSLEHLHKLYNTAQVYRVIPKPVDFDNIVETIKEIPQKSRELDQKKLRELLLELRINIYSTRGKYLISAINIAYRQSYLLESIKDLYSEVARRYGVSPMTVKWSIRTLIDTLNRSWSIKELCSIFSLNFKPDAITPKYFITLMVQYFQ